MIVVVHHIGSAEQRRHRRRLERALNVLGLVRVRPAYGVDDQIGRFKGEEGALRRHDTVFRAIGLNTVMLVAPSKPPEARNWGDSALIAAGKSIRPVTGTLQPDCS